VDADVQPREGYRGPEAEYERRQPRHADGKGHGCGEARRSVAGRKRRRRWGRHEHVDVAEPLHRSRPADGLLDARCREIGGGDGEEDGESHAGTPE
jgi:hypothetical protein